MNTRKTLVGLFESNGFRLLQFAYLADCQVLGRFRFLHFLELSLWRLCRSIGLKYPENCLLAVFERNQPHESIPAPDSHAKRKNEKESGPGMIASPGASLFPRG
jgi:hypothetical protein